MAPVTPCLAQYLWSLLFPSTRLHSLLWQWPSTFDLSSTTTTTSSSSSLSSSLSSLPPCKDNDTIFSMHWNVVLQVNGQTKDKLTLTNKHDTESTTFLDQVKSTPFWDTHVQGRQLQDVLILNRTNFTIVNCILEKKEEEKKKEKKVERPITN